MSRNQLCTIGPIAFGAALLIYVGTARARAGGSRAAPVRTASVASVGSIPSKMNPCNWYIEAERQTRGPSAPPDHDLHATYRDNSNPSIQNECAELLRQTAKRAGVKFTDYRNQLQQGMKSWHTDKRAVSAPVRRQGSVTFG